MVKDFYFYKNIEQEIPFKLKDFLPLKLVVLQNVIF